MDNIVDFNKLKRLPIESDIDKALEALENSLRKIREKHEEYFSKKNNPHEIDYFVSPNINSGFLILPYPKLIFIDNSLPNEIKEEVEIEFYKYLFEIINGE